MTLPRECPPLIAENIGRLDDLGRTINLERVASNVIDSSWHYSWHWDRDRTRAWEPLSIDGWRQALTDGRNLMSGYELRIKRIREVLPLIEAEIARLERW